MSKVTSTVCDMCGRSEREYTEKWGSFYSGTWVDGTDSFDLCPECCVKVQRFIRGHKEETDGEAQ